MQARGHAQAGSPTMTAAHAGESQGLLAVLPSATTGAPPAARGDTSGCAGPRETQAGAQGSSGLYSTGDQRTMHCRNTTLERKRPRDHRLQPQQPSESGGGRYVGPATGTWVRQTRGLSEGQGQRAAGSVRRSWLGKAAGSCGAVPPVRRRPNWVRSTPSVSARQPRRNINLDFPRKQAMTWRSALVSRLTADRRRYSNA